MTVEGKLSENGIFEVYRVKEPSYAIQKPFKNKNFSYIVINGFTCDLDFSKNAMLLLSFLEAESFYGTIFLSFCFQNSLPLYIPGYFGKIEQICLELRAFGDVYIIPSAGLGTSKTFPYIPLNSSIFPALGNFDNIHFTSFPYYGNCKHLR